MRTLKRIKYLNFLKKLALILLNILVIFNIVSEELPFLGIVHMLKDLKKVLIVDDEETLTWSMAKSLSKDKDKYEVIVANNGKEALNLLKTNRIDLVISDIRMPDINGLDLLVKIKKEFPETKVIIMTAYGSSDVQKEANRRGSLFYV
jgi:DNA-binding NtrC family response regulator